MGFDRDARRQRWFRQGAEALQRTFTNAPAGYLCPLCKHLFGTVERLTFEDVPPKSVGGKPLVLTCGDCNNLAGTTLDPHIRSGANIREMRAGERPIPVALKQFGYTINGQALVERGGLVLTAAREKSDPRQHDALFAELERASVEKTLDWDIQLTTEIRYSERRHAIGMLRVAYLYAFAALGYRFALRSELDPIREQFKDPEQELTKGLIKTRVEGTDDEGISFIYSPRELRSIVVRLGRQLFFFPEFGDTATFYERMADDSLVLEHVTMSGRAIDLPKEPRFLFDYEPKWVLATVPPEERRELVSSGTPEVQ